MERGFRIASRIWNDHRYLFPWLQLSEIVEKKAEFCLHNMESWCFGYPPFWKISLKLIFPTMSYHITVSSKYISGRENQALPLIPTPLWSWPCAYAVSPVQWGRHWPAQSVFKLLLLSDQILWFGAWSGAALELLSISIDLWEGSGRGQTEPSLLWCRLPLDLLPHYQTMRFVLEPLEDCVILFIICQDLSRSWDLFSVFNDDISK